MDRAKNYRLPDSFVEEVSIAVAMYKCVEKDVHQRIEGETDEQLQKRIEMAYDHEYLMIKEKFYKYLTTDEKNNL